MKKFKGKENMENPAEKAAVEAVLNGLARFSDPEREQFVTMAATIAISVMHGTYGVEFTAGFLRGAVESLKNQDLSAPIQVEEIRSEKLQ